MSTGSATLKEAMYVATELDKSWLQNEQRKLCERSWNNPGYRFRKLWGLVTDPRNLRVALSRVARNRGSRTAGVDGMTVRKVLARGSEAFVAETRAELRSGTYRPNPMRRVLIPKPGQMGKKRPLGIPTVKDRVIQAALKNILEPVYEADFYPVSYGFRPGRSVHAALEHLRVLLRPKANYRRKQTERHLPYQWAIEGDIKGCFDNIDHHALMDRVRRRLGDVRVGRLVLAFLKAGVLSEGTFSRTDTGTPQGGILSPLLANIALSAIEERYQGHVWPRQTPTLLTDVAKLQIRAMGARTKTRRRAPLFFPIRYADDFIILVSAPPGPGQDDRARQAAMEEKAKIAEALKTALGLELSESKTLVTPVTSAMRFLGHHVRVRPHPRDGTMVSTAVIPKERSQRLREAIKRHFRPDTVGNSLKNRLEWVNAVLRGWGYFYCHAWGAKKVFDHLDHYTWWMVRRWLRRKHRRYPMKRLHARYGWRRPGGHGWRWRDGSIHLYEAAAIRVEPYKMRWMRPPAFARTIYGEPGA